MSRFLHVAVVLTTSACGRIDFAPLAGDAACVAPATTDHDGMRLALAGSLFADGQRLVTGFYDRQRGENCYAQPWSDGNTYCVPSGLAISRYSDAACTQPIAEVFGGLCTPQIYTVTATQDACGNYSDYHLYKVGSTIASTTYYQQIFGSCVMFAVAPGDTLASLGEEVLISDLAAMSTTDTAGTAALALRSYSSSDGLQAEDTLVDTARGSTCAPSESPAGLVATPCIPPNNSASVLFGTATCTGAAYTALDASCPVPAAARMQTGCPQSAESYYRILGQTVTPPATLYGAAYGECDMTTEPGLTLYDLASTPEQFPTLEREVVADTCHRIELVRAAGDGAGITVGLYDSQLATTCSVVGAADGQLRCLPDAVAIYPAYTDMACTQPVKVAVQTYFATCAPPPPPAYAESAFPTACRQTDEHIYTVGAAITTPLFIGSTSSCVPFAMNFPEQSVMTYSVGTELDPTSFVSATPFHD